MQIKLRNNFYESKQFKVDDKEKLCDLYPFFNILFLEQLDKYEVEIPDNIILNKKMCECIFSLNTYVIENLDNFLYFHHFYKLYDYFCSTYLKSILVEKIKLIKAYYANDLHELIYIIKLQYNLLGYLEGKLLETLVDWIKHKEIDIKSLLDVLEPNIVLILCNVFYQFDIKVPIIKTKKLIDLPKNLYAGEAISNILRNKEFKTTVLNVYGELNVEKYYIHKTFIAIPNFPKIIRLFPNNEPYDIVKKYEMNHLRCWYDGEYIYQTYDCFVSINSKKTTTNRQPLTTEEIIKLEDFEVYDIFGNKVERETIMEEVLYFRYMEENFDNYMPKGLEMDKINLSMLFKCHIRDINKTIKINNPIIKNNEIELKNVLISNIIKVDKTYLYLFYIENSEIFHIFKNYANEYFLESPDINIFTPYINGKKNNIKGFLGNYLRCSYDEQEYNIGDYIDVKIKIVVFFNRMWLFIQKD